MGKASVSGAFFLGSVTRVGRARAASERSEIVGVGGAALVLLFGARETTKDAS